MMLGVHKQNCENIFFITPKTSYLSILCSSADVCRKEVDCLSKSKRRQTYKQIKMTKNTDQAMELQAMLPDGQQINEASIVAVSSKQVSESTVVAIEQVDEDNS